MASLSYFLQVSVLVLFTFLLVPNSCLGYLTTPSKNHAALFIFGDSIFDPGNNNYINTTIQANYYPYGETFFKYPTGRFCDGRLITDFIAEYAKLPFLPPYKLPGIDDYTNGVNFASSGAGVLAQTNPGLVIDLKTQVIDFKKVTKLLKQQLGEEEAEKMLSRAVYLFSIGANDYMFPFLINASNISLDFNSRKEDVPLVIGNITDVIKAIHKIGGRKFGFLNVPALGCAPTFRPRLTGDCVEEVTSTLAKLHNHVFPKALKKLERNLQGFKYSIFDFFTSGVEMLDNPAKYGFKEEKSACCGSGAFRGDVGSCGGRTGPYELCSNPNEYVYFDFVHWTEMAYQQFAEQMWIDLKALFEE